MVESSVKIDVGFSTMFVLLIFESSNNIFVEFIILLKSTGKLKIINLIGKY